MMHRLKTSVAVRPIDGQAADELVAVHGNAFGRAWSADEFASLLAGPGVTGWGLWRTTWFRPRRLAGFILVRAAGDEAEVLSVAVGASFRGRGYGRLLMEEALRRLYSDRIGSCYLEVDSANGPAVALYRSLGFSVASERVGYYADGGSALVMRLELL